MFFYGAHVDLFVSYTSHEHRNDWGQEDVFACFVKEVYVECQGILQPSHLDAEVLFVCGFPLGL